MAQNTNWKFTLSRPAHPDFTGSAEQILPNDAFESLIKRVDAKQVAAIATLHPSGALQYLYAPTIIRDLDDDACAVCGSISNEKGTVMVARISFNDMGYFHVAALAGNVASLEHFKAPQNLPAEALADTRFDNTQEVVFLWAPNFIQVLYGQDPPHGAITNPATAADFDSMGDGYESWREMAEVYHTSPLANRAQDMAIYKKAIELEGGGTAYVNREYATDGTTPRKKLYIPLELIPNARSVLPEVVSDLVSIFEDKTPASASSAGTTASHPEDRDKQEIIKNCEAVLSLLFLGGDIGPDGKITNVSLAELSASFKVVLQSPTSQQALKLANLLYTCFANQKKQHAGHMYSDTKMVHFQQTFCKQVLAGNFTKTPMSTMAKSTNAVSLINFAPQVSTDSRVASAVQAQETNRNEILMDISKSRRSDQEVTILSLGNIKDIEHVMTTLINLRGAANAFITPESMKNSVLLKAYERLILFYKEEDISRWYTNNVFRMHLHFANVFAACDAIFTSFGVGALDFVNSNIAQTNRPATELNMSAFEASVRAFDAFIGSVRNKAMLGSGDEDRSILAISLAPSASKPSGGDKSGGGKGNDHDSSKGVKKGRESDTTKTRARSGSTSSGSGGSDAIPDTSKGWVGVKKGLPIDKVLPSSLAVKICASFISIGHECTNSGFECPHGKHTGRPDGVKTGDLKKIAAHFSNNKGDLWFVGNALKRSKISHEEHGITQDILGTKARPFST